MQTILHNKYDKVLLKKKLHEETFHRTTLSFYRYVIIADLENFRANLYQKFSDLGIFGRIYVAKEGINAQISVPEFSWIAFKDLLEKIPFLKNMPLKIAVEDDGKSFYKLIVRIRNKIVADGLDDLSFDVTNVGKHLDATEFNDAMQNSNVIVVDMRNHYESEVGHFENAICPDVDTFREALPKTLSLLKGKEESKLLLYCTGGIRCEKASAYFRHHGFTDVNQLHGGIIAYAHQVKEQNLESKFKGKNFVFDERLGERIGKEVISRCHQCNQTCDIHVNCANNDCHLLFIQCKACSTIMHGCCTESCMHIISLPMEDQRKLRKGKSKDNAHSVYKSRLRPNLKDLVFNKVEQRSVNQSGENK